MKEFFYTISESMLDLGLRGTELFLYALIFRYSQLDLGCSFAKREILAKWCGVSSTRTIDAALQSLQEKGLIRKTKSIIFDKERTCFSVVESAEIAPQKGAKIAPQERKICTPQSAKFAPENKILNNTEKVSIPPTPQEVAEYAKQRGFADPVGFAAVFCEICKNNNWRRGNGQGDPIVNWKNYIVSNWEQYHKNKCYPRTATAETQPVSWEKYAKIIEG